MQLALSKLLNGKYQATEVLDDAPMLQVEFFNEFTSIPHSVKLKAIDILIKTMSDLSNQMETEFIKELEALLQKYPDIKLGELVVKAVSPAHRKTLEPYFQNYLFEADNYIVLEGLNNLLNPDITV